MLELDKGTQTKRKGNFLDANDIALKLEKKCFGLHVDWGGRHNILLPRQNEFQGVFYFAKHICGMDRGYVPEFPEWLCKSSIASVPLDEAMRNDFPILSMDSKGKTNVDEHTNAFIEKKVPYRVSKVGYRELFKRLLNQKLPGITAGWLAKTFRVPMEWAAGGEEAPMSLPESAKGVA